jgi:hypothetical protein
LAGVGSAAAEVDVRGKRDSQSSERARGTICNKFSTTRTGDGGDGGGGGGDGGGGDGGDGGS